MSIDINYFLDSFVFMFFKKFKMHNILVGKEGFEPTQPKATDLQSGVALQLYSTPLKLISF